MANIKKYFIVFFIGIVIGSASVGIIIQRRAATSYSELENRYTIIENTNRELREANTELISNNNQLREEQQRTAELISSGQEIIREFEAGLGESTDTIDRIERGIGTLERLISILLPEDID